MFNRYGKTLECPVTGAKFPELGRLNAIHDYKTKGKGIPENLDFLSITWASKLTAPNLTLAEAACYAVQA